MDEKTKEKLLNKILHNQQSIILQLIKYDNIILQLSKKVAILQAIIEKSDINTAIN